MASRLIHRTGSETAPTREALRAIGFVISARSSHGQGEELQRDHQAQEASHHESALTKSPSFGLRIREEAGCVAAAGLKGFQCLPVSEILDSLWALR
jgi:hypothetical protein